MRHFVAALSLVLALGAVSAEPATGRAAGAPCGGNFDAFVADLAAEAVAAGHDPAVVRRFFAGVRKDPRVLKADRAQGIFRLTFTEFARRVISGYRLKKGRENRKRHAAILARAEREYGVPPGILLAFWALETDFGAVQGDFNTRDALVTLAHDCRRPELFRPQVFAAIALTERGDFDPDRTTGAWAGEIGMVQMLPEDILHRGVDGDGDGHVRLKTSVADALMTGARMLRDLGWRPGEPWLVEVRVPKRMDWSLAGLQTELPVRKWQALGVRARTGHLPAPDLPASLILPEGRKGPAFLGYPNFKVLFEWNQSFVYVTTAAYLATRYEGAPVFDPGNPDPPLSLAEMKELQRRLAQRGYDVGKIDGILGAATRAAVRAEQKRLGLAADAWPTRALLARLQG